ncbi:MAG: tyrosine-type recombinase/integrase [Flavobacteriales bacterium]|nr:tyrosine-type recombinase/integrase [Flavobacteriales bacterium]
MELSIEAYLEQMHTPETAKSYGYLIDTYLATNPHARINTYADIVEFIDQLSKRIKNPATRGTYLAAIKRYYDYLLYTGQRSDHPCRMLSVKRDTYQIQFQELFSEQELDLLLTRENRYQHLETRNKAILTLLIYQGLRSEEITRIRLEDVDIDSGTIKIRQTKTSAKRILELRPNQAVYLNDYAQNHRSKLILGSYNQLFITTRGIPLGVEAVNRMIRPLQSLFPAKNLNPKTIRQSVISNWLNKRKIPLGDVQIMAGHKYPSSTERYLNQDAHTKRNLINRYHPLG